MATIATDCKDNDSDNSEFDDDQHQTSIVNGNTNDKKKVNKVIIWLLICTCILLIVVSIIGGVYVSRANSSTKIKYCASTQCLQLAADLSQSVNSSVDPCHDFYHYVCDGWVDDKSWINIDKPKYGVLHTVATKEKETFLDELFYNTKATLVNYSSVQKAAAYFQTCYDSTVDIETAGKSDFISKLINQTTFSTASSQWDSVQAYKFRDVMKYLTQINFNTFFKLESQSTKVPKFIQNLGVWKNLDGFNVSDFIPVYQTIFGLDAATAQLIAGLVQNFGFKLYNISTVNDLRYELYQLPSTLETMKVIAPFTELSLIFGTNQVINYTQLVYDSYGISPSDKELTHFQYYEAGLPYFQQLGPLIQAENPTTVQFYVWTSILYYYLDFGKIFSQSRYQKRSDFCFDRTKSKFPFVYGYILFNKLYNNDTHEVASNLASTIKLDGTEALIEQATWLDEDSKVEALQKIQNMKLWIGYPPRIKHGENIDEYYKDATQSMSVSWIDNVESLTKFEFKQFNDTFWGNQYNLTSSWPESFAVTEYYDDWLTGINAFYTFSGNWFTIPVSISQPPFLDASAGFPSSIMFGGLGSVTGHEMSHGFDTRGSQYNYNGSFVGSIFTNVSQSKYQEKVKCFVNQYNNISVDEVNGTTIYVNGTQTITENMADNAGLWASWTAWKKYIAHNGNDKSLYGVSFSQDQLFFMGFASLWCESSISGSVVTPDDVHSPKYARVIGTLQNNPHFAKAFDCDSRSRMNPENKCIVW